MTGRGADSRPVRLPAALAERLPVGWEADPYWQTALAILCDFPETDARIWAHVHPGEIDFAEIVAEAGWSGGQRRLLAAARSLWDGTPVSLLDLVDGGMGEHSYQLIVGAIAVMRAGLR